MVKLSKVGISLPFFLSTPEALVNEQHDSKKRARPKTNSSPGTNGAKSLPDSAKPAHRVSSVPAMSSIPHDYGIRQQKPMKRSRSSVLLHNFEALEEGTRPAVRSHSPHIKSEEYFKKMLRELGQSPESVIVDRDSFLPVGVQQHPSYPQAAMAARNEDLDLLRTLHNEGHCLQCANKFGESIIHIVCRRSRDDILEFLVSEVGVSLRLMDDLGRTPLHDAAWTDKPNFKLAAQLLSKEPDLIYTLDKRGNLPLAYVPQQNWGLWNAFLEQNKGMFVKAACSGATTVG
jgi:Ankyrin repeats (3 copies)